MVHPTLLITLGAHFCRLISSDNHIRPATTFHHILHIGQICICLELDHKLCLRLDIIIFGAMHFENMVRPALLITLDAPYFQILCDGLLLYGQTTAISKSRYCAWKICKIWWKVIAGRIWWWDDIEWQKCAPRFINNDGRTPKNATVKNFTSTDFLGPIKFAN